MGRCILAPLTAEEEETFSPPAIPLLHRETRNLVIPFQNEYLYAKYLKPRSSADGADPQALFAGSTGRGRSYYLRTRFDLHPGSRRSSARIT